MAKLGEELVPSHSLEGLVGKSLKAYLALFFPLTLSYILPLLPFVLIRELVPMESVIARWSFAGVLAAVEGFVRLAVLLHLRDFIDRQSPARFFPYDGFSPELYFRFLATDALSYLVISSPMLLGYPTLVTGSGIPDEASLAFGLAGGWAIVASAILVLSGAIVAYEGKWGIGALRRAHQVKRGHYLTILLSAVGAICVVGIPIGIITGIVQIMAGEGSFAAKLVNSLSYYLITPLMLVWTFLAYSGIVVQHPGGRVPLESAAT